MGLFGFGKRPKVPEGIRESVFECRRDNLAVRGTEYRPSGENLPVAIVSHGFMADQETTRYYAIKLAEMGYAAYCYDFCGGSRKKNQSDGATTEMSVLTEVMDLEAVIAYAQSLEYTSDELLLMGCSQGGFVSGLTAAKYPERVDKLVLFYPALCIPDDARAGRMMFSRFDPNNLPETIKCGPMLLGKRYAADVMDMDPFRELQAYTGRVLIVHGTNDKIVNLGYSTRAEEAYRTVGADVKLYTIEKGKHGFSKKHDVIAIEQLRRFAAKY